MKITCTLVPKLVLAALVLLTGTISVSAHDGQWDAHHHYYRDNYGYWDEHDHYHHYIVWHAHHGYWDTRGPIRIFINVD